MQLLKRTFVISLISLFLLFTSSKQVSAQQCPSLPSRYSYLNGRGSATVNQRGDNMTITLRYETGDEYLIRAERSGNRLVGDWALLRVNGREISNPDFRRYVGQVNLDCSIVGTGSDDPQGTNIDVPLQPQ